MTTTLRPLEVKALLTFAKFARLHKGQGVDRDGSGFRGPTLAGLIEKGLLTKFEFKGTTTYSLTESGKTEAIKHGALPF